MKRLLFVLGAALLLLGTSAPAATPEVTGDSSAPFQAADHEKCKKDCRDKKTACKISTAGGSVFGDVCKHDYEKCMKKCD